MGNAQRSTISRREVIEHGCWALAALSLSSGSLLVVGCDSGGSNDPSLPDGLTLEGNTLTVDLTEFPTLTETNGSLWIQSIDVILVNNAEVGFRAFSSVCPHEQEDVRLYEPSGSNGYQLRCPSHDWTFDVDGDPTGKAQAGLTRFPVSKNGDTLQITLDR